MSIRETQIKIRLLSDNVFTNPRRWAEKAFKSHAAYRVFQLMQAVCGLLVVSQVVMPSGPRVTWPTAFVRLLIPWAFAVALPLCWLRGLRACARPDLMPSGRVDFLIVLVSLVITIIIAVSIANA